MSRTAKILVAVAAGVGIAIVIGLLGARGGGGGEESQAQAQANLCASLASLQSASKSLTELDPAQASKADYQSAVSTVQDDWGRVKSDATTLHGINMNALDSAWDSFESAVKAVPGSDSASNSIQAVKDQAQALVTTTQSTLSGLSCSPPTPSTPS